MKAREDDILAGRLGALADPHDDSDWDDVIERASGTSVVAGRFRRHRVLLLAATVGVLMLALGAAIAATFGGFSSWLGGQPGSPASKTEQSEFQQANARAAASFPEGTKLRLLITKRHDGVTYHLLGFRTGAEICLRLVADAPGDVAKMSCIPRRELIAAKAPAVVVLLDIATGKTIRVATAPSSPWRGRRIRISSSKASFGVTAYNVTAINVRAGKHSFPAIVRNNAFLRFRKNVPYAGRAGSINRITATDSSGKKYEIPFQRQLSGFGGNNTLIKPRYGPAKIERRAPKSSVGWLERNAKRGQSLAQAGVPLKWLLTNGRRVHFARVIELAGGARVVAVRYGLERDRICFMAVLPGLYPGCNELLPGSLVAETTVPSDARKLSHHLVLSKKWLLVGIARDSVSRLTLFLDNGRRQGISIRDNAFVSPFPSPDRPARLVGYDSGGKVIFVREFDVMRSGSMPKPRLPRFGPTRVDHQPPPRSISWVLRRKPRGQSLKQAHINASKMYGYHLGIHFARVIQPDPGNSARVVIYVVGKHNAICVDTVGIEVGGGGCVELRRFALATDLSGVGGGDQTSLVSGVASDAIASIDIFLDDGERWPVPLKDNAFAVAIPSNELPARVIGYDRAGKIVAIEDLYPPFF